MRWRELHTWNFELKSARLLQKRLVEELELDSPLPACRFIAAVDISHDRGSRRLFAGALVFDTESCSVIERAVAHLDVRVPYVPGYLSFRELPPILLALAKLQTPCQAVLCDGQGIAHPRGLGIASHLGLWLQLPTIGCAKSLLWGHFRDPPGEPGSHSPLCRPGDDRVIGAVLRTKRGAKPLFVSPGHLCDVPSARTCVMSLIGRRRLPTPSQLVHNLANSARRNGAIALEGPFRESDLEPSLAGRDSQSARGPVAFARRGRD